MTMKEWAELLQSVAIPLGFLLGVGITWICNWRKIF